MLQFQIKSLFSKNLSSHPNLHKRSTIILSPWAHYLDLVALIVSAKADDIAVLFTLNSKDSSGLHE
jgi:hypothetical protein